MRVVLDTNIVFVSVSSTSQYHWVWRALERGDFLLCVTTDILDEYAEVLEEEMGHLTMQRTMNAIVNHPLLQRIVRYYRWNLIVPDPDDDKFVDCAIAANADFIVSEDRHFRILQQVEFPKIEVIGIEEFKKRLGLE
ncbi:MAG: hypothetical protein EPGJADBJ_04592 [Saprospiraceae bacterium]|nr:hypothetical protein [Saprospiraceae bacterium]